MLYENMGQLGQGAPNKHNAHLLLGAVGFTWEAPGYVDRPCPQWEVSSLTTHCSWWHPSPLSHYWFPGQLRGKEAFWGHTRVPQHDRFPGRGMSFVKLNGIQVTEDHPDGGLLRPFSHDMTRAQSP
jgi:hypothetical protein